MKKDHRGISLGTYVMLGVTGAVLLGCFLILPGLLGQARGTVDVRQVLSIFQTDGMPSLTLSDIPITRGDSTGNLPAPEPTQPPAETAVLVIPSATQAPKQGGTVTLTLGGTVDMDDAVRKAGYYSDSQKYDFTEMLALLQDEMTGDITFLTLENLIQPEVKVSALNAPDAAAELLRTTGVNLVAVGFPKVYDKGADGVRTTLEALHDRNLLTIGAYNTQEEANAICIRTLDNVPVAFLHYTEALSGTGKKAMKSSGASYAVPLANTETISADIRRAREQGAAVVVVSLNWGTSGTSKPTNAQRKLAQAIADAGADVIVGAGTRVVQPVTWLTHKNADGTAAQTLCAWSLGSLLNESRKDGNVAGMLLQLQISWDGQNISFGQVSYTPTYIWRQKVDGAYQYRVVASDQSAPNGMSEEQQGYMAKALRTIQNALADSPITIRTK